MLDREIKFQFIWKHEKSIAVGVYTLDNISTAIPPKSRSKNVMKCWELVARRQFTGLTDKNGVDIYEGDIVSQEKNCMYSAGRNNKEVRFELDQFLSGNCSLHNAVSSFDAEVIGNIHQNPELLS